LLMSWGGVAGQRRLGLVGAGAASCAGLRVGVRLDWMMISSHLNLWPILMLARPFVAVKMIYWRGTLV